MIASVMTAILRARRIQDPLISLNGAEMISFMPFRSVVKAICRFAPLMV